MDLGEFNVRDKNSTFEMEINDILSELKIDYNC
jgi:hypothetical protein